MRILKTDPKAIKAIAALLQSESIVIIPTDTVYGFSGIIGKTAHKIAAIKGRAETKPFVALIAHPEDIAAYSSITIPPELQHFWPGALTLIVPLREGGTQAFRCPADTWLQAVIRETGAPIYSTSVNYAGQPPLTSIDTIAREFEDKVSAIADAGPITGTPSTIINICSGRPHIIRQGSLILKEQTLPVIPSISL